MYDRLVFHPLPATPLAPALWIGLGPIGVGSLALPRLAQVGAPLWGDAAPAVQGVSLIGASTLWGFGLWWLAAASTLALAGAWHTGALEALGFVLFVVLCIFWVIVTAGTLGAIRSGQIWRR